MQLPVSYLVLVCLTPIYEVMTIEYIFIYNIIMTWMVSPLEL